MKHKSGYINRKGHSFLRVDVRLTPYQRLVLFDLQRYRWRFRLLRDRSRPLRLYRSRRSDSAASAFTMEVSLYNAALDPEFTGKFDDKLDENFAKVGSDNILKDASFDDLKKAFGINGGDELDEKKVKKHIEEVSKENSELFC